MNSTITHTARLLAGATLLGAVVVSVAGPASAASPSAHRLHHVRSFAAVTTTPRGVTLGSAVAYVKSPNGTVHAVTPTSLLP
jgi:glycerol dehydrogenase-like iron-containing ADH family enzyme